MVLICDALLYLHVCVTLLDPSSTDDICFNGAIMDEHLKLSQPNDDCNLRRWLVLGPDRRCFPPLARTA